MKTKIGRNDPCPCGSGRKYKHCHGRSADAASGPAAPDDHSEAVGRVLAWLSQRHRKAIKAAFEQLLFDDLWPEDGPEPDEVDPETWRMVITNLNEWMLADGELEIAGRWHPIAEYVLGDRGPSLSPAQRDFLRQLSTNPLRLYTVTEVRAGQGLTLVDALDPDSEPLSVQERLGSESIRAGMLLGCRLVRVGDHLELSGAVYPFSMRHEPVALAAVRDVAEDPRLHTDDRAYESGFAIMTEWVRQMLLPPRPPELIDASTGDPLLFVTDHYLVADQAGLTARLAASPDLHPDSEGSWIREARGDDGVIRSDASIRFGSKADRVEVLYRTRRLADEGRLWFEVLAGDCVRHLTREMADPAGAITSRKGGGTSATAGPAPGPDLPAEVLAQVIEQALMRSYANWPDEPIPALGGKTPRQAIRTSAGLERVKGLLRSYESNESSMAASQGRKEMSFQFLWDALGIAR